MVEVLEDPVEGPVGLEVGVVDASPSLVVVLVVVVVVVLSTPPEDILFFFLFLFFLDLLVVLFTSFSSTPFFSSISLKPYIISEMGFGKGGYR